MKLKCGPESGIIALSISTKNDQVRGIINQLISQTNQEIGDFRLYKYCGEKSNNLKYNGEIILKLISDDRNITVPDDFVLNADQLPLAPALFITVELVLNKLKITGDK